METGPVPAPVSLLQGTLDFLILKTLTWGPRHGYAIARWIEDTTDEALQIEEGSLYPALYRMERKGWVQSTWGTSELGRRAKLYALTTRGRQQLKLESAQWAEFVAAVGKIVQTA
jgi:PadR family transcriptional regulator, regulatory protein PadR